MVFRYWKMLLYSFLFKISKSHFFDKHKQHKIQNTQKMYKKGEKQEKRDKIKYFKMKYNKIESRMFYLRKNMAWIEKGIKDGKEVDYTMS